jgi:hydrocephalus-inducing protein
VRAVVLVNSGSLNYDFVWDMGTNPRVAIKPESGTVPKGERLVCELAYHPHVPDNMRDYKASCQIINGERKSGMWRHEAMQVHSS